MNIHQRLNDIANNLPAKPAIDLSKLTTGQLRYIADGKPIPPELLIPEATEALIGTGHAPSPPANPTKTSEVTQ